MTTNIRHVAYDIIVKVMKNNDFSDNLLQKKAKAIKHSEHDIVPFLYQIVKGTVKYKQQLDYIVRQFVDPGKYNQTNIKIKVLLYLGLYQLIYMKSVPDHAAINETVELAKTIYSEPVANFVNSVLRSYQRNPEVKYPDDVIQRIAYEYSYPVAMIEQWVKLWGADRTELLAMFFNEPSKLHLRVNTSATDSKKLMQYFTKRKVKCMESLASKNMLVCENAIAALNDVAFSEGYFSIQDASAALIVELLDPQLDESILDLFAAPGGKCTYIAEKMQNTGEVIAVDKSPSKMKLLKQAADRLQLTNINMIVQDSLKYGPVAPAYNRVLVDAPCSGWGVMGRKADLRWQQHHNIDELIKLQENALNYGANFVKNDGFLVYSTCTMNPRENEEQVNSFLKKNLNFKLVDANSIISQEYTEHKFLKTVPYKHFMDGAFAAKMQRTK